MSETGEIQIRRCLNETFLHFVFFCNSLFCVKNNLIKKVQTLIHLFTDMINGGPVSKPVITQRLQNDRQGKEIQTAFTVEQVVNQLKYKRKQKREKMRQKAKNNQ